MSAVVLPKTLSTRVVPAVSAAPATQSAKGVLARIWDAIVAARMAQAEREVAFYTALHHSNRNR